MLIFANEDQAQRTAEADGNVISFAGSKPSHRDCRPKTKQQHRLLQRNAHKGRVKIQVMRLSGDEGGERDFQRMVKDGFCLLRTRSFPRQIVPQTLMQESL